MKWLLPPIAAGLWIVLALLTGLIWVGAVRTGMRAEVFAIWAAASAAIAVAIVATRGAPRSRVTSAILSIASIAGSATLLGSSIPSVAAMALILSMAIAVVSLRSWVRSKQPD